MEEKQAVKVTDFQAQVIISTYVLAESSPTNTLMRAIIFSQSTNVDWQLAWENACIIMPELNNVDKVKELLKKHFLTYEG